MVTFTRVASLPLTRIPVYPIPAPASEVVTTAGKKLRRMGRSWPKLREARSSLVTSENGTGWFSLARRPATLTSSNEMGDAVSESFACSCCAKRELNPSAQIQIKTVFFIRKLLTNKRGNYSVDYKLNITISLGSITCPGS